MRQLAAMAAVCVAAAATGGCGAQQLLLGTESEYLFLAMDELIVPGRACELRVQIRGGDFLSGLPGLAVRFFRNGELYKVTETGDGGAASVTFTPETPGDYEFEARVVPAGLASQPPAPAGLLIACRPADAPIVLVDLDKTIVASGFEAVLLGSPEPMARSQQVLARLAGERTVVYLTHRPELFGPKSKRWLADHGFPRGPVLLSGTGGFLQGSGRYKARRIAEMRETFTRIGLGIGDKISDARAYLDNGMTAVVILNIPPAGTTDRAEKLTALAGELETLKDDEPVHVVTGWDEVEKAVFDGTAYPPSAMRKRLLDMAR